MNTNQHIQDYLTDELSDVERQKIEEHLMADQALKAKFDEHVSMSKAFKIIEAERLKIKLQGLEQNEKPKYPFKRRPLYFSFAATVLVLIGLGVYFNFYQTSLYTQYFEVYPNVYQPVVRGDTEQRTKAFMYYENQKFKKAKNEFERLLKTENNPNVKFYYALSLLNSGQTTLASEEFDDLKNIEFEFQAEVFWYYALAEVRLKNFAEANNLLYALRSKFPAYKTQQVNDLIADLE